MKLNLNLTCGQVRETIERHICNGGIVLLTFDDGREYRATAPQLAPTDTDHDRFLLLRPDDRGYLCLDQHDEFTLDDGGTIHTRVICEGYETIRLDIRFLRPASVVPHRRHECGSCGHEWSDAVKLGATPNLSGEVTRYCPCCGQRAAMSSPWFFADSHTIPEPEPASAVAAPSTVELALYALRQAEPAMHGHPDDHAMMSTFETVVDELRKVGVLSAEQANSLFRTTWRKQDQP